MYRVLDTEERKNQETGFNEILRQKLKLKESIFFRFSLHIAFHFLDFLKLQSLYRMHLSSDFNYQAMNIIESQVHIPIYFQRPSLSHLPTSNRILRTIN